MPLLALIALVLSTPCSAQEVAHPVYPSNVTAAGVPSLQADRKSVV